LCLIFSLKPFNSEFFSVLFSPVVIFPQCVLTEPRESHNQATCCRCHTHIGQIVLDFILEVVKASLRRRARRHRKSIEEEGLLTNATTCKLTFEKCDEVHCCLVLIAVRQLFVLLDIFFWHLVCCSISILHVIEALRECLVRLDIVAGKLLKDFTFLVASEADDGF